MKKQTKLQMLSDSFLEDGYNSRETCMNTVLGIFLWPFGVVFVLEADLLSAICFQFLTGFAQWQALAGVQRGQVLNSLISSQQILYSLLYCVTKSMPTSGSSLSWILDFNNCSTLPSEPGRPLSLKVGHHANPS
jgi:hypothetical protein